MNMKIDNTKEMGMKISDQSQEFDIAPDAFAVNMLTRCLPYWMPEELREEMVNALRGYDRITAISIADCLIDCSSGGALRLLGDPEIDKPLRRLYRKILKSASSQGIKNLMFPKD